MVGKNAGITYSHAALKPSPGPITLHLSVLIPFTTLNSLLYLASMMKDAITEPLGFRRSKIHLMNLGELLEVLTCRMIEEPVMCIWFVRRRVMRSEEVGQHGGSKWTWWKTACWTESEGWVCMDPLVLASSDRGGGTQGPMYRPTPHTIRMSG